ncbi:MAG: hypothetical protein U0R19_21770 [Bryobacteraceae bacterium]
MTITTSNLTLYTISRTSFNMGGTISAGTVIDGYQLVLNGGIGSDYAIDDLSIVGDTPQVPDPGSWTLISVGLLGIVLASRRK